MYATIAIILVALVNIGDVLKCPHEWTFFDGYCWLLSIESLNWTQAKQYCEHNGGDLAIMNSTRQIAFVKHLEREEEAFLLKQQSDSITAERKNCFTRETNVVLIGFAVTSLNDVESVTECLNKCAESRRYFDFVCKSLLWYSETHQCILNDANKEGNDGFFLSTNESEETVDYYENRCLNLLPKGTIVEKTSKPHNLEEFENCFDRFDHSLLIGFADRVASGIEARECLAQCAQCSVCLDDEPCNAVVYYSNQKECIMMVATRRGNEEYFLRDNLESEYYERRKNCNESGICAEELSIIFVMDGSDSIGNDGFNNAKVHIDAIITAAHNIVEDLTVTIVQSGSVPTLEIDSMNFDKMASFKAELNAIEWRRGSSMLGATLEAATNLDASKNAWMVVLTDGINTGPLHNFIKKRTETNINVFVISLTDAPNREVLLNISGREDFIFINKTIESLITFFKQQLCPEKTMRRQTRSAITERRVRSNDELWLRTSENGNEPNVYDQTLTISNQSQNNTTTRCSAIVGSRFVMTDCSRSLRFVCRLAASV